MNKKGIKIIIQQALARSPHNFLQTFQNPSYNGLQMRYQAQNESYLDKNLSNIHCDYMTSKQFSIFRQMPAISPSVPKQFQRFRSFEEEIKQQPVQMQQKLISIAKKLQQNKDDPYIYDEAEDIICEIPSEEAHNYKNYLMHIYKWILNQKGRVNQYTHGNCEMLKGVVVRKLCDAYRQGEVNREIEEQLSRLQILAKARQYTLKGDNQHAKIKYEKVFKNQQNNEAVRMEAIQYLCKYSSKKGDRTYLNELLNSIGNLKGSQRHKRCLERTLSELNDRMEVRTSLEQSQK